MFSVINLRVQELRNHKMDAEIETTSHCKGSHSLCHIYILSVSFVQVFCFVNLFSASISRLSVLWEFSVGIFVCENFLSICLFLLPFLFSLFRGEP